MLRFLVTLFILTSTGVAAAQERPDATLERARQVIESYVTLERAYDPRLADLYADEAVIKSNQVDASGEPTWITVQGWKYKRMIREAMPKSRSTGYRASYTGARYELYGKNVRVSVTQYVDRTRSSNPIQWVIGPGRTSQWLILEETSVRR